jgi:ribosomal protein S27AE
MTDPHLNPIPGTPSNLAEVSKAEHAEALAKPARKRPTFRRPCPECGETFTTHTHDRMFCSDAHKAAFHNRSSKVGRSAIPLALAWREGRNVKGKSPEARAKRASAARAFSELCRILDAVAAEQREAGSMAQLDYLRRRWSIQGDLTPVETARFHEAADAKLAASIARREAEKAGGAA